MKKTKSRKVEKNLSLVFPNARRVLSQCNTRLRLLYLFNIHLSLFFFYSFHVYLLFFLSFPFRMFHCLISPNFRCSKTAGLGSSRETSPHRRKGATPRRMRRQDFVLTEAEREKGRLVSKQKRTDKNKTTSGFASLLSKRLPNFLRLKIRKTWRRQTNERPLEFKTDCAKSEQ